MQFLILIQRTPRRVIFAFVFAYGCTLAMAVLPVFKPAQMFWQ
jgi:hypothetical protein